MHLLARSHRCELTTLSPIMRKTNKQTNKFTPTFLSWPHEKWQKDQLLAMRMMKCWCCYRYYCYLVRESPTPSHHLNDDCWREQRQTESGSYYSRRDTKVEHRSRHSHSRFESSKRQNLHASRWEADCGYPPLEGAGRMGGLVSRRRKDPD